MRVRVILHIHTKSSPDSYVTPKEIIDQCNKHNIDYIGITDHNTADGAIEFKKEIEQEGIKVIIGEEIMTDEGEIIGLFLKETINNKDNSGNIITLNNAIDAINNQDGLVFAPHPFDVMRSGIGKESVEKFKNKIDAFEIFNSRTKINYFNKQSEKYIKDKKLTPFIGSDAHITREIANSIIEMDNFKDKEEFLKNLRKDNVKYFKKRLKLIDIIRPTMNKIKKRLIG